MIPEAPSHEGTFAGHGGTPLFRRGWAPAGKPMAALVLVHGLGDHSGLYASVARHLVPRGYAVEAFDGRGHGRSPGPRGHIDSWDERRADLRAFVEAVRLEHVGPPLFLVGNSAGGLGVLEYALRHPDGLAGVVAASPAIGEVGVSAWLIALARLLSHVWPTFSLDVGLEVENLSRDPAEVRAIVDDPLFHTRATARGGDETLRAVAWTRAHAGELRVPLLLLHGSGDRITSPESSRSFLEAAGSTDKERREYAGAFHNLFHETNASEVLADVADWLDRRVAGAP
jgi:alpha-beta hydrolase superfamily lysophospholipase